MREQRIENYWQNTEYRIMDKIKKNREKRVK